MLRINRSRPRELILEVLKGTTSHPTAEWVYMEAKKKHPKLSLGTVYRNLRLMVERGEVLELDLGTSFSRYDGSIHEHSHFLCQGCGSVLDLDFIIPEDFYKRAAKGRELTITGHKITFSGFCTKCRKN